MATSQHTGTHSGDCHPITNTVASPPGQDLGYLASQPPLVTTNQSRGDPGYFTLESPCAFHLFSHYSLWTRQRPGEPQGSADRSQTPTSLLHVTMAKPIIPAELQHRVPPPAPPDPETGNLEKNGHPGLQER